MSHWDDTSHRGPEVSEVVDYDEETTAEEIDVQTPMDLEQELARLVGFLADLESPWQTRMACMKRIQSLVTQGPSRSLPNFIPCMHKHHVAIATQLVDRRSKVVKEASLTLQILAASLKSMKFDATTHAMYIECIQFFVRQAFQAVMQTVKVIAESGRECMQSLVKNVVDDSDHQLLGALCDGCTHVHPSIRGASFACISLAIHNIHDEIKAPMSQRLGEVIRSGLADSAAPARTSARQALAELHRVNVDMFTKIRDEMPSTTRRLLDREMGGTGSVDANDDDAATKKKKRAPVKPWLKKRRGKKKAAAAGPAVDVVVKESATVTGATSSTPTRRLRKRAAFKDASFTSPVQAARSSRMRTDSVLAPASMIINNGSSSSATAAVTSPSSTTGDSSAAATPISAAAAATAVGATTATTITSAVAALSSSSVPVGTHNNNNNNRDVGDIGDVTTPADNNTESTYELLCRLLDLEKPVLTERMMEFLTKDGVMDELMKFMSRFSTHEIDVLCEAEAHKSHAPSLRTRHMSINFQEPQKLRAETTTPTTSPQRRADTSMRVIVEDDVPLSSGERRGSVASARANSTAENELVCVRRSYQTMRLLCTHNADLLKMLSKDIKVITKHVLSSFHPTSLANFYHTCQLFSHLVRWFPSEVLEFVLTKEGSALFRRVFDNLHEPPVGDAILDFLCESTAKRADKVRLFRIMLQEWRVMEILKLRICSPVESEATSSCNALFLMNFLDRMTVSKHSVILMSSVCASGSLVEALVHAVCDERGHHPSWQRLHCAELLGNLLKRTHTNATSHSPLSMKRHSSTASSGSSASSASSSSPNRFSELHPILSKTILPRVPDMCAALSSTTRSRSMDELSTPERGSRGPVVRSPVMDTARATQQLDALDLQAGVAYRAASGHEHFTKLRLAIMQILCHLEIFGSDFFDKLSSSTWDILVEWFFHYRHNNIYLSRFRTLFVSVLKLTHEMSLSFIFMKVKFVQRMIQFYMLPDPKCSLHAFILEFCLLLRDIEQREERTQLIPRVLAKSKEWHAFQPILDAEQAKQNAAAAAMATTRNGSGDNDEHANETHVPNLFPTPR